MNSHRRAELRYYAKNRALVMKRAKKWKAENPERAKAIVAKYNSSRPERFLALLAWRKKHPIRVRETILRTVACRYLKRLGVSNPPESLIALKLQHMKAKRVCLRPRSKKE